MTTTLAAVAAVTSTLAASVEEAPPTVRSQGVPAPAAPRTPLTREGIEALIARSDRAVERAILAIYARQTADEREAGNTRHSNGMGFAAPDAGLGSYYARWILSGRRLTGGHLARARQMSRKYAGQLLEVARDKAVAKAEQEAIRQYGGG